MTNNEEKEMKIKFDEIVNKELTIVNLFNSLYQDCYKEYYREFNIKEDEKFIIFQLLKEKLKSLELTVEEKENNSDQILKINLFRALFMDEKDFSLDDLDRKSTYFDLILEMMNYGEPEDENEKVILTNLNKEMEISSFNKLFSQFDLCEDYDYIYYHTCLYLIFKYSKLKSIFVNSIIVYANIELVLANRTNGLYLRKNYEDEKIEKMPKDQIVSDLSLIYEKIDNYTILYIKKNHLKLRKMSNEEINKEIAEITEKKKKRKRNKKSKNIEINKKHEIAKEKIPEKKIFDMTNNNNNNNWKLDSKFQENNIEKKNEAQINELQRIKSIKETQVKQDDIYKKMEIQNETQNEKIKDLERELECHKKDVEKQNEKIKDLERKLECHKKDAEKQKKEYQKTIRNVKHKLEDLSIKSIKFEYELRLIQARDAIKNIIDLFSKALGVEQDISYNDKIFAIKEIIFKKRIKGFNIDKDLVIFLDKIYRYLNFSNRNAHSLNLDQPILDQIFDYIEPNNNLKELKKKMEEGNMNNLLKDLAKNREKYFNNKYKLIEEERKIIDKVKGINDLIK